MTLGGTTFDTPAAGPSQPVYNLTLNILNGLFDVEFTGAGLSTGAVFNSTPSGTCPAGDMCVLELFDSADGAAGAGHSRHGAQAVPKGTSSGRPKHVAINLISALL